MFKRTIGVAATAAAISIAALLPAGASTSPNQVAQYAAGSKATALELTVFGTEFTVADTAAGVLGNLATTKADEAVADGRALLVPGLFESKGATAKSAGPTSASDCTNLIDLPSPIDALSIDVVCVDTSAVLKNGLPASSSASREVVINIKAADLISETPLAEVVAGVQDGLGSLFDAIVGITAPIEEATKVELTDIIDGLLAEVKAGDLLATITVAPASSTGAVGSGVSANAIANGVVVELLPNLPGGALAVATVGASTAGVVRDVATGAPTLTGNAALLNVTYPNGLAGGLSVLTDALGEIVNITSEQLACGPGNPLSDVICFTLGTTRDLDAAQAKALGFDYGPNTVGRESSVLGLTLLAAAPDGGIVLNVGHTAAASGSQPAPPRDSCPETDPNYPTCELPDTGGTTTLMLTLGLLGIGAAGATMLRRARTI